MEGGASPAAEAAARDPEEPEGAEGTAVKTVAPGCCQRFQAALGCPAGSVRPPAEEWEHRGLIPLALAQMFLMADQPLLPVNLSAVAQEFGMDDTEKDEHLGGTVALVFFSAGAAASLLAGRLADVTSRRRLLAGLLVIGGIASFANSRVRSYTQLLLCRAVVGVAFGGVIPVTFAVIGDLYAPHKRPHAIALLAVIAGIGPGIGQVLAGSLGASVGWRVPFAIVGLCTVLFGLLLPQLLPELDGERREAPSSEQLAGEEQACNDTSPVLAAAEAAGALAAAASVRGALVRLLATPTVLLVFLQGAAGCVPWAVIQTFLTDFLAVDSELGVGRATAVQFAFGAGAALGTVCGGRAGQCLYRRSKRLQPFLMGVTALTGTIPMLLLVALPGGSQLFLFYLLAFLGGSQASVAGGNAKAVLLNTSAQEMRGTAFGIYNIMDDLGKGLGPAIVSRWVRYVGRRTAFALGITCWLPCGLFCFLMCLTVTRDEAELAASEKRRKGSGPDLAMTKPAEAQACARKVGQAYEPAAGPEAP